MLEHKTPKQLSDKLKEYVIGQDQACNDLSLFLFNYLLFHYAQNREDIRLENPPVCLIIGESGSGKTHLVKMISKIMNFDLLEINGKSIAQEGWNGESLKNMILTYAMSRPKSKDQSIKTIIFIDEFDKVCQPISSSETENYNVHTQNSFLKYLEGFKIENKDILVDLKSFCFILGGNFQGIRDQREKNKKQIGFRDHEHQETELHYELESFGMIPEIIGRISNFIELNYLTRKDYEAILHSKNTYFKNITAIMLAINMELDIQDQHIEYAIDKAIKSKIGVRGLIQELNKILNQEMIRNQDKFKVVSDYFNYLESAEEMQYLLRKKSY